MDNVNDIQQDLIRFFITDYLDGNIERIASFDLHRLKDDERYGKSERWFGCDYTKLMRAIYCVVYGDAWEESLETYIFCGDTINTYNTMFGCPDSFWLTKDISDKGIFRSAVITSTLLKALSQAEQKQS